MENNTQSQILLLLRGFLEQKSNSLTLLFYLLTSCCNLLVTGHPQSILKVCPMGSGLIARTVFFFIYVLPV